MNFLKHVILWLIGMTIEIVKNVVLHLKNKKHNFKYFNYLSSRVDFKFSDLLMLEVYFFSYQKFRWEKFPSYENNYLRFKKT